MQSFSLSVAAGWKWKVGGLRELGVRDARQCGQHLDIGVGPGVRQGAPEAGGRDVLPAGRGNRWHHIRLFIGQVRTKNHALHIGRATDHIR